MVKKGMLGICMACADAKCHLAGHGIFRPFFIFYYSGLVSEIEEAFKMDEAAFKSRYRLEKPAQDALLVTSCKIGGRAAKAGQALSALGYSSVQVYSGSFTDWQNKGGPVEKKSV